MPGMLQRKPAANGSRTMAPQSPPPGPGRFGPPTHPGHAREHEVLITIEEGAQGGFGAFVLHFLSRDGQLDRGLKIRTLTLPDIFQDHDKPEAMYAAAGLDADAIANAALLALGRGVNEVRA